MEKRPLSQRTETPGAPGPRAAAARAAPGPAAAAPSRWQTKPRPEELPEGGWDKQGQKSDVPWQPHIDMER